ncbi:MAG: hypothetical protein ACRDTX_14105 [Pseudonocardiaceae bacterium]
MLRDAAGVELPPVMGQDDRLVIVEAMHGPDAKRTIIGQQHRLEQGPGAHTGYEGVVHLDPNCRARCRKCASGHLSFED